MLALADHGSSWTSGSSPSSCSMRGRGSSSVGALRNIQSPALGLSTPRATKLTSSRASRASVSCGSNLSQGTPGQHHKTVTTSREYTTQYTRVSLYELASQQGTAKATPPNMNHGSYAAQA